MREPAAEFEGAGSDGVGNERWLARGGRGETFPFVSLRFCTINGLHGSVVAQFDFLVHSCHNRKINYPEPRIYIQRPGALGQISLTVEQMSSAARGSR